MKGAFLRQWMAVACVALASAGAWAISIISGPYLQNVTPTSATIVWRTDSLSTAWVETAPDDNSDFYATERPRTYQTDLGRAVFGTLHKVTLKGLTPGTRYRYRVFSEEVKRIESHYVEYGRVASTRVYKHPALTFSTPDATKPTLDFVMINDQHGDTARIARLLRPELKSGHDFVLFAGDMVDYMDTESQVFEGAFNTASQLFAAELPFYMVRGNHETRGKQAKAYMDYFVTPTGKPYYWFRRGPVAFVVLDGGEDKADNDIEYSRSAFFDEYRREEARWLADAIKEPEFRDAPFKVCVIHVPTISPTWHGPIQAKQLFVPLLNEAGIDLMLSGHLHKYRQLPAGTDGGTFPILVNSNHEKTRVHADATRLTVTTVDTLNRPLTTLTIPRKK